MFFLKKINMIKLVIGGGGFLGTRIVEMLLEKGFVVRVYGRGKYTHLAEMNVECVQADICDCLAMEKSMAGVDTVFHVAAKAGYWGKHSDYVKINVEGTKNVIRAMRLRGVQKLVYTSSPSVVGFNRHLSNVGQDIEYPKSYECSYPQTKALAEQIVKEANGPDLATVSIRPHMIFGPKDRHVFLPMIRRANGGKMIRIGKGNNLIDLTFVDNAAGAHIDAAKALYSHKAPCAGKAYFISNDDPVVFYSFFDDLLRHLGIDPVGKSMSRRTGRVIGVVLSSLFRILPLKGNPPLTPYLADMMAFDHWYDIEPAKRDLGYRVRVSMKEGVKKTVDWLCEEKPWLVNY